MNANQKPASFPFRLLSWALCILLVLLAIGAAAGGDGLSALLVIAGAALAAPPVQQMFPIRRGVCLALAGGMLVAGMTCSRYLDIDDGEQASTTKNDAKVTAGSMEDTGGISSENAAERGQGGTEQQTSEFTENRDLEENAPVYLDQITWAALASYQCAVEREDFDGDVIRAGTYRAEPILVTDSGGDRVPIVWDIYVSDENHDAFSELSEGEWVATVGGWGNLTGEFIVEPGQYVYIKYTDMLGNPVGAIQITRVET